jgi:hypothetical protein
MRRILVLLLLASPAMAQTVPIANSINSTNAGQATGTVLNSNQQINQFPVMQQEYGAGYRCQNSTISLSPYYVGSSATYGSGGGTSGFGGMMTLSVPLDSRGVEHCMAMAKARVEKEQFDLVIVRALKCADLLRAGIVFTTPETQKVCDGLAYVPQRDGTKGVVLPQPQKTPQLILTN